MASNRVAIYVIFICIIAITITFILGKLANRKRIFKYIPAIISAIGGIGLCFKAFYFSNGYEGIIFLLLAMAAGIFTVASLVAAALMDLSVYESL